MYSQYIQQCSQVAGTKGEAKDDWSLDGSREKYPKIHHLRQSKVITNTPQPRLQCNKIHKKWICKDSSQMDQKSSRRRQKKHPDPSNRFGDRNQRGGLKEALQALWDAG